LSTSSSGKHDALFEGLTTDDARLDRLCELNVIEQVVHVCRTTVVQDAWKRGQQLAVHAWIYALADGLVRELGISADGPVALDNQYKRALAALQNPDAAAG
jgi:carbonic anhydrase